MTRTTYAAIVITFALPFAACAAFSGSSSDGTEGPALDASSGASGDALVDGADNVDDGATLDGGPEANCAPREGGFCASVVPAPTFCADFDNPQCSLLAQFEKISKGTGTTVAIDSTQWKSTPSSLHVVQAPGATQTVTWGTVKELSVPSPNPTAVVKVSLQFLVQALPPEAGVNAPRFGPIALVATSGPTVVFYMESDKSYFEIGTSLFSSDGPMMTPNKWHELDFVFTIDGSGATLDATVDGAMLWTGASTSPPLKGGQTLKITTGLAAELITQGEIWVDNVVVRTTP